MITRKFLLGNSDGLEFLDFQNDTFFKELVKVLEDNVNDNIIHPGVSEDLAPVIEKYTGFRNIKYLVSPVGMFGIDAGYLSPNNVINNAMVDDLLNHTQTTLYDWFSKNKGKIFRGSVDYTSGKVTGDFCDLRATMYLEPNLKSVFDPKVVAKYGATMVEALAGAIAHELGHMFGACMMLATTVKDNLILKAGLQHYKNARTKEDRLVVLRDTNAILEGDNKKETLDEISKSDEDGAFILYYSKMIKQRNTSRAFSFGVPAMTSEVLADAYALRMGCGKGIIGAVGALVDRGGIKSFVGTLWLFMVLSIFLIGPFAIMLAGAAIEVVVLMSLLFGLINAVLAYFGFSYSDVYNAGHRRFDDLLRQLIAEFKNENKIPKSEKREMLKQIEEMIELNKDLKPWYENTFVRTMMGAIMSGKDFKANEIEHFVSVLGNHEINILGDRLKNSVA